MTTPAFEIPPTSNPWPRTRIWSALVSAWLCMMRTLWRFTPVPEERYGDVGRSLRAESLKRPGGRWLLWNDSTANAGAGV